MDWLESVNPGADDFDKNDTTTFRDKYWPSTYGGLTREAAASHNAAAWFIRTRPAVKRAFSTIWSTEDLLTSFDCFISWRQWDKAVEG